MDEVVVDNEEAGFIVIRDAIQKLYDAGYKAVNVDTSVDENGHHVVTVTPRGNSSSKKELDEMADKEGFLK